MEHQKKLLAWLLTFALILGMLPVLPITAMASQTEELAAQTLAAAPEQPEVYTMELPFQVNPLYEGILDPTDFANTVPEMPPISLYADYVTEERAVQQLRENLEARVESISVMLETEKDPEEASADLVVSALAHTGVPTQGDYIAWQYAGYSAKIRYSQSGNTYYCTIQYSVAYYTTAAQEARLDAEVDTLLGSLALNGKSKYEKIKTIYDYICDHTVYDNENLNDDDYKLKFTAYAALIDGTAVCQGYAVLLYRLALASGVDCRVITGTGNGGNHAWNIVRMDDGLYYNTDATWDAEAASHGIEYGYFLRCDGTFEKHERGEAYTGAFYSTYPMGQTDYDPSGDPPEPSEPVRGDFNQDGKLTVKDAVILLRVVLLSADLPSVEVADFNADGAVDEADAIRIVTHLLFPDDYPLHG